MSPLHPVTVVVGPTASGKTAHAVQLALQQPGSVVLSADSQLVYRGLDIGTAKPTAEDRQGIPHYGMDCAAPTEAYSAARYRQDCLPLLQAWLQQGKPVVVAGGTGFYLRQLFEATTLPEVPPNPALRATLQTLAETQGNELLHRQLAEQDSLRASQLHPNDRVRVIRALEIIAATGKPVPQTAQPAWLNTVQWVGLWPQNQSDHWARILSRIDAMLAAGWLEEVEGLMQQYGTDAHALQVAHGYPELVRVLQGQLSLSEARQQIYIHVRQYARRQLTWFKRNPAIQWLPVA